MKRSLEDEIPWTYYLDEYMGHQATYKCTEEAQVMAALLSLLCCITHHAFYEDYCA